MDFVQKSSGRGAARVLIKTVTDEIDQSVLNQDKLAMLKSALDSLSSYYESKSSFPSSLRK
jgi:hypothetical protein